MKAVIINMEQELQQYLQGADLLVDGHLVAYIDLYVKGSITAVGGIIADRDIEAGRDIIAGGDIKAVWDITADRDITAGRNIKAGGDITAVGEITAVWDIKAGRGIEAGRDISAIWDITAGGDIKAQSVFSYNYNIVCQKLKTQYPLFNRQYYLDKKPLRAYRDIIADTNNCYEAIRTALFPDARKICAWKGWHWIERAHLLMFFGLVKDFDVQQELERRGLK